MPLVPNRATRSASSRIARVAGATLALCLTVPAIANATWSVIAVDKSTGRIVIASATCVGTNEPMFLRSVQAVIVPGKGVAACQSSVDNTHKNQMLIFNELQKGTDPKKIMQMLTADPGFQGRQFGIVDLSGRTAGHSGFTNGYVTQDMQGQVPGTEIFYSIQGNILRANEVVPNAVKAFLNAKGALTDRVMAAMEAADAAGGDSRCTCTSTNAGGRGEGPPIVTPIPCEQRTATISYIVMAEPKDKIGQGNLWSKIGARGAPPTDSVFGMAADNTFAHYNGNYSLFLTVTQPNADGNPARIKPGENLNPVKTLRMRYDAWRKTMPASYR